MLEAVTFLREIRAGSSLPLIVDADDGRRYVMKARGSGDGALASIVDWIALRLGRRLGIPTLWPQLIRVQPRFERHAEDPEIRDLLRESYGENLATRWIEDTRTPGTAEFDQLDPATRRNVLLFDLLLLNVDRTEKNPNAIIGPSGFRCLDFSSAMALRRLFSSARGATPGMLKQIRRNPFYTPGIDPAPFMERLQAVSQDEIEDVVDRLPLSWQLAVAPRLGPELFNQTLTRRLGELLEDVDALPRRLTALQAVPLETGEERQRRSTANRIEFESRFGKL